MGLTSPPLFFDGVRKGLLGPTLEPGEVSGCEAILSAMGGAPLADTAYALGTAYHETASTMQPIDEYGGNAYFTRMYDVAGTRPALARQNGNTTPGDGIKFHGRGYVQLTWRANYARAGAKLGLDLISRPEDALKPDVAAKIMRRGMDEGWFTGKRFKDYLPRDGRGTRDQFVNARRIINGVDRAAKVASHAAEFQSALEAGGWT